MLWLSYYCLCLLFNKIGEEGQTGSAWKQGSWEEWGGQGGEMAQNTYAYMNKWRKKRSRDSGGHDVLSDVFVSFSLSEFDEGLKSKFSSVWNCISSYNLQNLSFQVWIVWVVRYFKWRKAFWIIIFKIAFILQASVELNKHTRMFYLLLDFRTWVNDGKYASFLNVPPEHSSGSEEVGQVCKWANSCIR
jgi:hypothetical protein